MKKRKRKIKFKNFRSSQPFMTWKYIDYALRVLNGRWIDKEPEIMEDPSAIFIYAKYVLKRRWKEAEHKLLKEEFDTKEYIKYFFGNKFPEDEIEINPLFDTWHEMMLEKIIPSPKFGIFDPAFKFPNFMNPGKSSIMNDIFKKWGSYLKHDIDKSIFLSTNDINKEASNSNHKIKVVKNRDNINYDNTPNQKDNFYEWSLQNIFIKEKDK